MRPFGRCAFFLTWGYFIGHLVIFPPLLLPNFDFVFSFTSLSPWPPRPVKCNLSGIITRKLTLTPIRSVLLLKHNKGVEYMSNNKPYQYHYNQAMQVSMPESLYSVVYSETAFRGLTQHPSHFHTIADAQAFIDDCVKPYQQDAYIIQVPVIATSIQS